MRYQRSRLDGMSKQWVDQKIDLCRGTRCLRLNRQSHPLIRHVLGREPHVMILDTEKCLYVT